MAVGLESIRVLQDVEQVADELWKEVIRWDSFARQVVGGQLQRAVDSIGANIAEAFGRYHYGEKLQFLYYARGSLFESKYWLNRSNARALLTPEQVEWYATQLTSVARQLNAFASKVKSQRYGRHDQPKQVRESEKNYTIRLIDKLPLFNQNELNWLSGVGDYAEGEQSRDWRLEIGDWRLRQRRAKLDWRRGEIAPKACKARLEKRADWRRGEIAPKACKARLRQSRAKLDCAKAVQS